MKVKAGWFIGFLWLTASLACAHADSSISSRPKPAKHPKVPMTVAATFDGNGRLWLVSPRDGFIWLRYSDDIGKTFSAEVKVNATQENIAADGDNRPKIAIAQNGDIYVSYTKILEKPITGDIRLTRSTDGGKTFPEPVTVNDNREIISHRFEALGIGPQGTVWLAWLDKRDLSAAQRDHRPYTGAAIYYAESNDGGASFKPNVKIADHSCECCRVAMALDTDGKPVVFWRHIFGKNIRDHAMARLDATTEVLRVSYDNWEVDACPHHGPAISIGPDGVYHMVWFTAAPGQPGLIYRNTRDRGAHFSGPIPFGNVEAQAGHPDVLSLGKRVTIVWKEFDGERTVIYAKRSVDGGEMWSQGQVVATTSAASDYPLVIGNGGKVYLSWYAAIEGYRLIPLDAGVTKP